MRATKTEMDAKGLSLTELLVSSIIIGIVMVGVVSFNYTVGRIEKTTNRATIVKIRAAAAMLQIKKDISKAVGDSTNPGIYVRIDGPTEHNNYCVRHDFDNDPTNYSGDQWICSHHGGSYHIRRYVWPAGITPACIASSVWPASNCNVGATVSGADDSVAMISDIDLLQLADDLSSIPFVELITNVDDQLEYVNVRLQVRYDPDIPVQSIDNPQYVLETRINPFSHTR